MLCALGREKRESLSVVGATNNVRRIVSSTSMYKVGFIPR